MKNGISHKEGKTAKMLEDQTAKIPSDIFLWAALGTMAFSVGLLMAKQKHASLLVSQWAPSLLIIGLYNKLVKTHGHDQEDQADHSKKRTQPATP